MRAKPTTVAAAAAAAQDNDGVLSRTQLHDLGVNRWDIRREVRSRRWQVPGRHAVALHTGPLDQRAWWRVAVIEAGRHAALDGVTALLAAGLRNYSEPLIHVSVPRGAHPGGCPGGRFTRPDVEPTLMWSNPGSGECAPLWRPCTRPCGPRPIGKPPC